MQIHEQTKFHFLTFKPLIPSLLYFVFIFFYYQPLFSQNNTNTLSDDALLESFLKSKNYSSTIVFDSNNIKTFWIDKSVLSNDGLIYISLLNFKSVSLPVLLKNVNESLQCKVDVISTQQDLYLNIYNDKPSKVPSSFSEETFLNYNIYSVSFNLEDTKDNRFNLVFSSRMVDPISIKKIVFSFSTSPNSFFVSSPKVVSYSNEDLSCHSCEPSKIDSKHFSVYGTNSIIASKYNFLVFDREITASISIKNTGTVPTEVSLGYILYDSNRTSLQKKNYPLAPDQNQLLTVISPSAVGSSSVLVDTFPQKWSKGAFLALNAKDSFGDIPNMDLINETILDIKKKDDKTTEIILSKPLSKPIETGAKLRIHGFYGGYLYTNTKVLNPGEETTFSSTITKNDEYFEYSSKSKFIPHGVYFVKPVIVSNSVNSKEQNAIQISDFRVSF